MATNNQTKSAAVDKEIEEKKRVAQLQAEFEAFRKALVAEATKLGQQAAAGATSLLELAFLYNDAARRRLATVDDARLLYGAYATAHNEAVSAKTVLIGNVSYSVTTDRLLDMAEKSVKTPISMFRSFAQPAVVALGLDFFQRVQTIAAGIEGKKRIGSVYNCLVVANRRACDKAEHLALADKELDQLTVTDVEIVDWISAKPKAQADEKSFEKRLEAVIKEMAKLVKSGEEPTLRPIYNDLCDMAKRREELPAIPAGVPGMTVERVTTH